MAFYSKNIIKYSEEFVIVLSSANAKESEQFSNGLRKALSEYTFDGFKTLTCSFGVTQILKNDTMESFIERADKDRVTVT